MAIRAASHDNSQLFSFRSVKPCEVKDGLKKLKLGKAMGWDRIPPRALKAGAFLLVKRRKSDFFNCNVFLNKHSLLLLLLQYNMAFL